MTERELSAPVRAAAEEERALQSGAIVVERGDRRRWLISGPRAAEVLNGLVTSDISALKPGAGCYAAALTPKGKVIADLRIFAAAEGFVADTSAAAATGLADMFRKYVNPRLARIEDVTAETVDLGVAGPAAAGALQRALKLESELDALQSHAHMNVTTAGPAHLATRTPELEVAAFDVLVAAEERNRIHSRLIEAGVIEAAPATWEVARIARGWPVWGKDMDENTLAQEAGLDRFDAISYTKGCYTGQETVARVHFRGHVNRYLRRARFTPGDEVPRGAELFDDQSKPMGDVRSSALTKSAGVAIAMVRREVTSDTVRARWNGSEAELMLLPE